MGRPPITLAIGARFGRLVVLGRVTSVKHGRYLVECDCGNQFSALTSNLTSGNTKSCGCLQKDMLPSRLTHGESSGVGNKLKTPEYSAWQGMLSRCYNSKVPSYRYYGGRGIQVCERWRRSYTNFLADMGRKPSLTHSLDRIDCNDWYRPENCRWATSTQQNKNRRPCTITAEDLQRLQERSALLDKYTARFGLL